MSWGDEDDYQEWLVEICEEENDANRGWFFCDEDERSNYLEEHPEL